MLLPLIEPNLLFELNILRVQRLALDLINLSEMLVHHRQSTKMRVEVIGTVTNGNGNNLAHLNETSIVELALKLRVARKLNFVLGVNRSGIVDRPFLSELVLTLDNCVVDFGFYFLKVILDNFAFLEECSVDDCDSGLFFEQYLDIGLSVQSVQVEVVPASCQICVG